MNGTSEPSSVPVGTSSKWYVAEQCVSGKGEARLRERYALTFLSGASVEGV